MSSWNTVLEGYARSPRPRVTLPPGVFLTEDEHTLAIFDGFEKARFHFLVMPRDPFKLSSGSQVPSPALSSLSTLLKSPDALEVLNALKKSADDVKAMIQDEMVKTEGWSWPVQTGFHASESMRHVHLHVISSDLLSPKLKNKKHYNSFHPKLGFFLHLDDVIEQVKTNNVDKRPTAAFESILKQPLQSIYTGEEFSTIPKLKVHLEAEFAKAGRKAKKLLKEQAERVEKRKGDELDAPAQEQKKRKESSEPK